MLKEIRDAAKQFGREQGAKGVVIQGGARTSGANPGRASAYQDKGQLDDREAGV